MSERPTVTLTEDELSGRLAEAQAQVANAVLAWAAENEITDPPLDWAWLGEILRRYSPLHEMHEPPA